MKPRTMLPFHDKKSLIDAVAKVVPIPAHAPIPSGRVRQAYRALLAEAAHTLMSVHRWAKASIGTQPVNEETKPSKGVATKSLGGYGATDIMVRSPEEPVFYVIACAEDAYAPHSLALTFNGHVEKALRASLEAAYAISQTTSSAETAPRAYEILSGSIARSSVVSMFRGLLEQPPSPLLHFMLGHRPFTSEFQLSATIFDWLATVPSLTYEGAPLQSGIVFESAQIPLRKNSLVQVHRFPQPSHFHGGTLSGQLIALADGVRSFLVVTPALEVVGLAVLTGHLASALEHADGEEERTMPFDALWVQVRSPTRLSLFGSQGTVFTEVGQVRNGSFILYDRIAVEAALTHLVASVTESDAHPRVPFFARALVGRADSGHGTGVVVGTPRLGRKASRLTQPVRIDEGANWLSFLNPDGAVLVNSRLELRRYGVILPQPKHRLLPGHGTRHNALAEASRRSGCVAIAVSDDSRLSAFREGAVVLRA